METKEEEAVPAMPVCFSPPDRTGENVRTPLLLAMPSLSLARPSGDYLRQRSRHGWLLVTREVIEYWEAPRSPLLSFP